MFGIDEAIDRLAVEDRAGWSGAAFSARVVEITADEERLAGEKLRCLGEWDAALAWAEDGSLTAVGWLSRETPVTLTQARDLIRAARLVEGNQATGKALAVGDVSVAHVQVAAADPPTSRISSCVAAATT